MIGRNGVTTKFNHTEPLEYYFDLEDITPEMLSFLSNVMCSIIDLKQEIIPINVFGHPVVRKFAGSRSVRIFFEQGKKEEAFMFMFKFSDAIIRHNLGNFDNNTI